MEWESNIADACYLGPLRNTEPRVRINRTEQIATGIKMVKRIGYCNRFARRFIRADDGNENSHRTRERSVDIILINSRLRERLYWITDYFSQGALELSNILASIPRILGGCSGEKKLREDEMNQN